MAKGARTTEEGMEANCGQHDGEAKDEGCGKVGFDDAGIYKRLEGKYKECGDCWIWTAGVNSGGVPQMRLLASSQKRKTVITRRWIAEQIGLKAEKKLVTNICQNKLCIAPDHLQVMTRAALQKRSAKTGYHKSPIRNKKLQEIGRKRAKVTQEQIDAIRASDKKQRELAEEYGLTQSTVSKIIRREMWREYGTNPFQGLL